jgi:glycosyltransferase involved in cell wall biosynthesis
MKILAVSNFFPPNVLGGYEVGCHDILHRIARNAEVHVATSYAVSSFPGNCSKGIFKVHPIFDPCDVYSLPANSGVCLFQREMGFAGYRPSNIVALRNLIVDVKPDLIYLFNILGLGPVGILELCVGSGIPTICHLMDDWDGVVSSNLDSVDLRLKWASCKAQARGIACSQYTLISNSRIGSFENPVVIPSGVEFPNSIPPYMSKSESPKFLYYGQLHRGKGVHQIIRAFQRAKNALPKSKPTLTIIGKGDPKYIAEINRIASEDPHSSPAIKFISYMPKDVLMKKIPSYTIAFFPLRNVEAFGYAPVESVASGVPAVICEDMPLFSFIKNVQPSSLKIKSQDDIESMTQIMMDVINSKIDIESARRIQFDGFKKQFDEKTSIGPRLMELILRNAKKTVPNESNMDGVISNAVMYKRLLSIRKSEPLITKTMGQTTKSELNSNGRLVRLARVLENKLWGIEKSFWGLID